MFCLSETWFTEEVPNALLGLSNYHIFRQDRLGRMGGGVMICTKMGLHVSQIETPLSNCFELVAIDLYVTNRTIRVVCAYFPPENAARGVRELVQGLRALAYCW